MDERALKLGRSRSDSPLQASRERGTCWHHGLDFQPLEQDPINSCYVKPVGYFVKVLLPVLCHSPRKLGQKGEIARHEIKGKVAEKPSTFQVIKI